MSESCILEGRFSFDFTQSINAYKADDPSFNALGGVDFIVELEDKFIFIEVKDLENKNVPPEQRAEWVRKLKISADNPFLRDLGIKFKDTLIRNWAKGQEFNKPIYYTIILQLDAVDATLKLKLSEDLDGRLPNCINEKHGFIKILKIKRKEILSVKEWLARYPQFSISEVS